MSTQNDNNGKILGLIDIMNEINLSEKEERQADFSNKTLSDFSVVLDKISHGLNMENAKILGPVFLGEIVINGTLNMKGAIINGSLYLGKADIKGDLILDSAQINGAINLVGAKIEGNLLARQLMTIGFLSLTKTEVSGDITFEGAETKSANYDDLMVRGDAFLDSAIVKGSINLGKMKVEGNINLDDTQIGSNLVLTGAESKKGDIDTTTAKIGGKKII